MKQRPPFVVRVLGMVALVASAGLSLYWFIQNVGLFRFLAQQQSKFFGGYDDKVTVLLTWLFLFVAMVIPLLIIYRFTRWSEEKITTPGMVSSVEEEAAEARAQKAEQKILRAGASFKRFRSLALMSTLLLAGTGFGIFRLVEWIQGNLTDPVGLIIAGICALIGAGMFRSHFISSK